MEKRKDVSSHIKLRQYGSAAQAVLQHHHGVSQSVLVQLGGILRRLLRDVLEIGLRVRLLFHHVVDGCQENTHARAGLFTQKEAAGGRFAAPQTAAGWDAAVRGSTLTVNLPRVGLHHTVRLSVAI